MNVKDIRRTNLRALAKTMGGITYLANRLSKSQSQISQLIGKSPSKNIGDKIAHEVEEAFNKPHGWMDILHNNIEESTTMFELVKSTAPHRPVPLLHWQALRLHHEKTALAHQEGERLIAASPRCGEHAFAFRLRELIAAPQAFFNYPADAIVIVDPSAEPADNAYVITHYGPGSQYELKKIKSEGKRYYLRSLDNPEATLEPCLPNNIYAVVKQIIVELD